MRKSMTTKGFVNKKMNAAVYLERRTVIDLIYKAKNLLRANSIQMPRVDIRITEREKGMKACGVARMNGNIIWIPADYLNSKYLYQIVLHELCHALWGIGHSKRCKLMHPNIQSDLTNDVAEKLFLKYAIKQG